MDTLTIILAVATLILIIFTLIILGIVLRLLFGIRRMFKEVDQVVGQSKEIVSEVYDKVKVSASPWVMAGSLLKLFKERKANNGRK